MCTNHFDWNESTWTVDYRAAFDTFKNALAASMELIHPDFSLQWILLPDASDYAAGYILLQLRVTSDGSLRPEPIAIGSKKFSAEAARWHTNEKELYAIYFGVTKNDQLLRCKSFLVATDHANLTYLERDDNIFKLQRWRMTLQT